MREGHIHGVEFLVDGPDEELIKQANMVLKDHASQGVDGVEVWSGRRFVYRYPPRLGGPLRARHGLLDLVNDILPWRSGAGSVECGPAGTS
jgi:hypothetical protein